MVGRGRLELSGVPGSLLRLEAALIEYVLRVSRRFVDGSMFVGLARMGKA